MSMGYFQRPAALSNLPERYHTSFLSVPPSPQEAISAESFFPLVRRVCQGDVESGLEGAEHVLEGEAAIGGQDHFYLETQACLAAPQGEAGEMVIVASTQGAEITQRLAARALDVPENRIVARTKRIGEFVGVAWGGAWNGTAFFLLLSPLLRRQVEGLGERRPVRATSPLPLQWPLISTHSLTPSLPHPSLPHSFTPPPPQGAGPSPDPAGPERGHDF